MNHGALMRFSIAIFFASLAIASGGELRKSYFTATKPGAWSEYLLTSADGSKSSFTYQRRSDDNSQIVIGLTVRILGGQAKDSTSMNTYRMRRDFDLKRDGLSFGKFIEKMSMSSRGMEMTVDDATLDQIRRAEKDFRGAITFQATEEIAGRTCDRYAYSLRTGGPMPADETGTLWLSDSVPFGIVRQVARVSKPNGARISGFEMQLQDSGVDQSLAGKPPKPAQPPKTTELAAPVTLQDGYKTGKLGIEVAAVEGSAGRRLSLTLENKTEAALTVTLRAGNIELQAGSPVNKLRFKSSDSTRLKLPAEARGAPLVVEQRGNRGLTEGRCVLSIYEGKALFSGSVTIGPLPK